MQHREKIIAWQFSVFNSLAQTSLMNGCRNEMETLNLAMEKDSTLIFSSALVCTKKEIGRRRNCKLVFSLIVRQSATTKNVAFN